MITMSYKMARVPESKSTVHHLCFKLRQSVVTVGPRSRIPHRGRCRHKHNALFMFKQPLGLILIAVDDSWRSMQVVYVKNWRGRTEYFNNNSKRCLFEEPHLKEKAFIVEVFTVRTPDR